MELIFIVFALGISIATAVLAPQKGRNSINWFFLSLFWGVVGLVILACSKHLEREKEESDTLSKVLWTIVLIPLVLFAVFLYSRTVEKRDFQKNYQVEEVSPKIELFDNYIEREVDLNDYLGDPDDGTDWNYTEIDEETQRYLKKIGIYLSAEKKCWVKKEPIKN